MSRSTIEAPTAMTFDGVVALKVRLASGAITVHATDDSPPGLRIDEVEGPPMAVTHDAGILTVAYEDLTWEGLRRWLRSSRRAATVTVTVPTECPVQLGVVTASAMVSGLSARLSIKSMSGDITLDQVNGPVEAQTMSGDLEATGLTGSVGYTTVSGRLTVAGGALSRLTARSMSGRMSADVDLARDGRVQIGTVSGAVALRLPASLDSQVELRSTSGRIDTAYPGLDQSGRPGAATATGTVGEGTGQISITTISGDIALLRRDAEPSDGDGAARVRDGRPAGEGDAG